MVILGDFKVNTVNKKGGKNKQKKKRIKTDDKYIYNPKVKSTWMTADTVCCPCAKTHKKVKTFC